MRKQIFDNTRRRKVKETKPEFTDGTIDQLESKIQKGAVETARKWGYIVKVTSRNSRNAVKGLPDTFSSYKGTNLWVACDFKTAHGQNTPEQDELVKQGNLDIVRSTGQFMEILSKRLNGVLK